MIAYSVSTVFIIIFSFFFFFALNCKNVCHFKHFRIVKAFVALKKWIKEIINVMNNECMQVSGWLGLVDEGRGE